MVTVTISDLLSPFPISEPVDTVHLLAVLKGWLHR